MSNLTGILKDGIKREDEVCITAAELMTELMMVFLFIDILYIHNVERYLYDVND